MTYQKSCPNCHMIVKGGHGAPMKRLGTPIARCEFCGYTYLDNDILEWSVIPVYRKIGFCFANNRWAIIMGAMALGMLAQSFTLMCILAIIAIGGCTAYALHKGKQFMPESVIRSNDALYIQLLIKSGYEVASRFENDT